MENSRHRRLASTHTHAHMHGDPRGTPLAPSLHLLSLPRVGVLGSQVLEPQRPVLQAFWCLDLRISCFSGQSVAYCRPSPVLTELAEGSSYRHIPPCQTRLLFCFLAQILFICCSVETEFCGVAGAGLKLTAMPLPQASKC